MMTISWGIRPRSVVVLLFLLLVGVSCGASGTAHSPVLYIGWDDAGRTRIFRIDSPDAAATPISPIADHPGDVFDFAPSPDGRKLAYSVLYDNGDSAVFVSAPDGSDNRELLACPAAECTMLVWEPGGRRLLYERRSADSGASPYLYWLDAATGETLPLLDDEGVPAYGAAFAPDGAWLSYVSLKDEGVVVYRLADGQQRLLASYTGMPAVWGPSGARLIVSDLELIVSHGDEGDDHTSHSHDYSSAVHLFLVDDLLTGERRQISPDQAVDDGAPAWSPDGAWIVFGRRYPDTNSGRQLWLARPDGGEARPLTDDATLQHGAAAWSPDGQWLVYQRSAAFEPGERASIWLMDVNNGEQTQLAPQGFQPVWAAKD